MLFTMICHILEERILLAISLAIFLFLVPYFHHNYFFCQLTYYLELGGGGRSAIQRTLGVDAITAGGGGGGADCLKKTGCGGGGQSIFLVCLEIRSSPC